MAKQKSNYQLLEENRAKVLEYANQVAKDKPIIVKPIYFKKSINSMDDLTESIKKLDERKDNRLGIVWSEDQNSNTRVRDARNVDPNNSLVKEDLGEKYAMQVLNQVRGGILLLEQNSSLTFAAREKAIAQLLSLADKSLTEIDELPKRILAYNNAMVNILEDTGIKDADEQLNFAKEIASFKDDHQHIVTLSIVAKETSKIVGLPISTNTAIEADVMLNGLTKIQREQYAAIARSKKGTNAYTDVADMSWYNKLPEYQRNLIHDVAGDIATGKKVIPAQLRELIGVRNGYEKTTAIISPPANELETLTQSLHCGAPASKNKHGADNITQQNIEQLQSFVEPDSAINLENLTSKTTRLPFFKYGFRGENWISKQLEKVVKAVELVTTTMSPINRWRLLGGGRQQDAYKQNLATIAEKLAASEKYKGSTENIQKLLINGPSTAETTNKAYDEINALTDIKLQRTLIAAMDARENLSKGNWLGDAHNNNAETIAQMQIVQYGVKTKGHPLNELFGDEAAKKYSTNVIFCKSGKDRTGLAMLKASFAAISSYLGLSGVNAENALKALGASGHTQEMAGTQGGSVGNHSVKMSAEFGLNPSDQALEGVINQKSSGYNSEIKLGKTWLFGTIKTAEKLKAEKEAVALTQELEWTSKRYQSEKSIKNKTVSTQPIRPTITPDLKINQHDNSITC